MLRCKQPRPQHEAAKQPRALLSVALGGHRACQGKIAVAARQGKAVARVCDLVGQRPRGLAQQLCRRAEVEQLQGETRKRGHGGVLHQRLIQPALRQGARAARRRVRRRRARPRAPGRGTNRRVAAQSARRASPSIKKGRPQTALAGPQKRCLGAPGWEVMLALAVRDALMLGREEGAHAAQARVIAARSRAAPHRMRRDGPCTCSPARRNRRQPVCRSRRARASECQARRWLGRSSCAL